MRTCKGTTTYKPSVSRKTCLQPRFYFAITRNTARPQKAVPQREHASAKDVWPIAKYLGRSKTLWKVTGSEAYAARIRVYLKHPDSQAFGSAKRIRSMVGKRIANLSPIS